MPSRLVQEQQFVNVTLTNVSTAPCMSTPIDYFVSRFLKITFFLSNVAALNITVQPETVVGQSSLVIWQREPSDNDDELVFDLRFVQPGSIDVGLAVSNIQAPSSAQFGTVEVVFPSQG